VVNYSGKGVGGGLGAVIYFFVAPVTWFLLPNEVENDLYEASGEQSPVRTMVGLWILLPIVGAFVWYFKVQGAINDFWIGPGSSGTILSALLGPGRSVRSPEARSQRDDLICQAISPMIGTFSGSYPGIGLAGARAFAKLEMMAGPASVTSPRLLNASGWYVVITAIASLCDGRYPTTAPLPA
jgi:hypothetical protein